MKKYSLAALQMAYLGATMKETDGDQTCLYCWENKCGCEHKETVKNDPFINLTFKEELHV